MPSAALFRVRILSGYVIGGNEEFQQLGKKGRVWFSRQCNDEFPVLKWELRQMVRESELV